MCNRACIHFAQTQLLEVEVRDKRVIDVGSRDFNGSLRSTVERLGPAAYVGVDLDAGPGVDEICAGENLIARFGDESFDVVLCTEVLEHVRDWRVVVSNLKRLVAPGGVLLVTTRSKGFGYHAFPFDFWRYEPDDIHAIFGDLAIDRVDRDSVAPGVFLKARRRESFVERDLADYRLYSMVTARRSREVGPLATSLFLTRWRARRFVSRRLPTRVRSYLKQRTGRATAS